MGLPKVTRVFFLILIETVCHLCYLVKIVTSFAKQEPWCMNANLFQQVDIVYSFRFVPFGLGGLSGEDGEHRVTYKESSRSFDIK